MLLFSLTNETNMSLMLCLQGNIRVFCRVRPLTGGGLSQHLQLPATDNKTITLAKTQEVRIYDIKICMLVTQYKEKSFGKINK